MLLKDEAKPIAERRRGHRGLASIDQRADSDPLVVAQIADMFRQAEMTEEGDHTLQEGDPTWLPTRANIASISANITIRSSVLPTPWQPGTQWPRPRARMPRTWPGSVRSCRFRLSSGGAHCV